MIECSQVQSAVSARLDGEQPGVSDDVIDAHLIECQECRRFVNEAAALKRSLNFCSVDTLGTNETEPPDLSELILAGVEPQRRRQASRRAIGVGLSRVALVACALGFLAWALQLFVASTQLEHTVATGGALAGSPDPYIGSLLVEGATVRLALAFGLVCAVWRSRIAVGLLPVYGALFTFSLGFGARDLVLGMLDRDSLYWLFLVGVSAVVLLGYWLADRGLVAISIAWRQLSAQPYS